MLESILLILLAIALILSFALNAILTRANLRFRTEIEHLEEEARGNRAQIMDQDALYLGTVQLLYQQLEDMDQELRDARDNLTMVLASEPTPFNDIAVEIGLHGVVYQFHALEDVKEITA